MSKSRLKDIPLGALLLPKNKAIKLIRGQIEKAYKLQNSISISHEEHSAWEFVTRNILSKILGSDSQILEK
jgi:hypothetical protein